MYLSENCESLTFVDHNDIRKEIMWLKQKKNKRKQNMIQKQFAY